jgi:hypothetical protein
LDSGTGDAKRQCLGGIHSSAAPLQPFFRRLSSGPTGSGNRAKDHPVPSAVARASSQAQLGSRILDSFSVEIVSNPGYPPLVDMLQTIQKLVIELDIVAHACVPALGKLKQEGHLSLGVGDQPGQHSKTLSFKNNNNNKSL